MNPGELIHDRYVLDHLLGKGGMAEVWCARDQRLERPVAIKFLAARFADDPEFLVRFFSEAQSVARISHANVVPVLDFGELGGRPYLVMEYIGGGSIEDLNEPLEAERAVELITGAARGAGAAHSLGLVHRDIKPANILVSENGHPKLADFGISVSGVQEKLTATGTAIGSPHYVSPEQASGAPTSPASDVYSLGIVLYELLAGRRPFEADTAMALAIAHVEEPPQPPSSHVPDLDPNLDALVMSCLAKAPGARPPDGNALADALERREAPVIASAATAVVAAAIEDGVEAKPGWGDRKRTLVASGIAVVLLVTLAFGALTLGRRDDSDLARADDKRGATAPTRSPSSSPTGTDLDDLDDTAASAPASTPTPQASNDGTENASDSSGNSGGNGSGQEPAPEPTQTKEPREEPTTVPTEEPEPAPTSSP